MRKWLLSVVVALSFWGTTSPACGYSECDVWGGIHGLGGANLYGFSSDMYNVGISTSISIDTTYVPTYSYGGGCGSLISTCGGGFDFANLNGSNYGLTGLGGYSDPYGLGGLGGLLGAGLGSFPGMGITDPSYGLGNFDVGCALGYCGTSVSVAFPPYQSLLPQNGFDPFLIDPSLFSNPGFPNVYTQPVFSVDPFSPVVSGPGLNPVSMFPSMPPPSLPPAGTCDNILVPCPASPVGRPPMASPIPPFTGLNPFVPPVTSMPTSPTTPTVAPTPTVPPILGNVPGSQPDYRSRTENLPVDPVRVRVPRGTH